MTLILNIILYFCSVQPGPSKVAPPTPTTEESIPLIPTDHSTSVTSVAQNRPHQVGALTL